MKYKSGDIEIIMDLKELIQIIDGYIKVSGDKCSPEELTKIIATKFYEKVHKELPDEIHKFMTMVQDTFEREIKE